MKVWTSKYRRHWVSPYTIAEKICFWRDINYDEPWVRALNRVTEPACQGLQWFLDKIHPRVKYVKIDSWDSWSLDHTLADIIAPALKQLKATKHGSPMVDEEDVPVHLQSEAYKKAKKRTPKKSTTRSDVHAIDMDDDSTLHERWDWVLNEMIWSFDQMLDDEKGEAQFWDHSASGGLPWESTYTPPECDWAGLKRHQERMQNGFRLFGKYYLALWD